MAEFDNPCAQRQKVNVFAKDGNQYVSHRCTEQTAEHANQTVTPDECRDCPVRAAALRQAQVSGAWIPGQVFKAATKAKDQGGDGFVACNTRMVARIPSCCGSEMEIRICDSTEAKEFGKEVTPIVCAHCPHRNA